MMRNGKLAVLLMMLLVATIAFAGCGSNETQTNTQTNTDDAEESSNAKDVEISGDGKTLVVYFSHSGNTKKVAENIQQKTGADIFEITTVREYSDDYNTVLDEAQEELNEKARPELSAKAANIEQYETIILGYPIWWGDMPMAVYSFLDEYDLSGKNILPFCTHGGSGLSGTDENVRSTESTAKVADGLAISDSSLDDSDEDIDTWLKDSGLAK